MFVKSAVKENLQDVLSHAFIGKESTLTPLNVCFGKIYFLRICSRLLQPGVFKE